MPITFKSKHTPNILMLESIALQLIKMMGHHGTVPGAIAAEDVAAALQRIEQKLAATDIKPPASGADDRTDNDSEPRVTMGHRALPLIGMLHSAIAEGDYVIWE